MTSSVHSDNIYRGSDQNDDDSVRELINKGLAPALDIPEERPPDTDDYTEHKPVSLAVLETLLNCDIDDADLADLLLLCSQHCSGEFPWSSPQHCDTAEKLLKKVKRRVRDLLSENDYMMFKNLLETLQPQLEEFTRFPASVASLCWLTSNIVNSDHGSVSESSGPGPDIVARLLPHALHWTDCWMPHYKVCGCTMIHHIISLSSAADLLFYGRAELLSQTLFTLLSHNHLQVVSAAGQPLVTLTHLTHHTDSPAVAGAGDTLVSELITRLELSSDTGLRTEYCDLLLRSVSMLGVGVARWVTRISQVLVSQLEWSPALSVFRTVSHMAQVTPECVSREMVTLLPALIKYLYHVSHHDNSDQSLVTQAVETSVTVSRCDPHQAASLCHDLQSLSVNNTFDLAVTTICDRISC